MAPFPVMQAPAMRGRPRVPARAWLASLALCAWLACFGAAAQQPAAIPPLDAPVVDTTGTLDAATVGRLDQRARDLQQRKGSQLQVLMVASTAPDTIEQYAQRVFDAWKLGRPGVDDGVLLLVAKDDRKVRIQPGYGLEGAIPDITAGRVISEYLAPKFRQGDYAGGIDEATAQLVKLIDGEALPEPISRQGQDGRTPGLWIFALMAALFASFVARGVVRRLPAGIRAVLCGAVGGLVAWTFSALVLASGVGVLLGVFVGLMSSFDGGRYVRGGGDWGGFGGGGPWTGGSGGGFGGGSSGGFGGGWSGGGGMSGGGGASGSW